MSSATVLTLTVDAASIGTYAGPKLADKAVAEGRCTKFKWKPDLRDGKILGFWIKFEDSEPELIR